MLALIAGVAVNAVVWQPLGELAREAPQQGAGVLTLQSDPAPPYTVQTAGERAKANASQSESNKRDTGNPPPSNLSPETLHPSPTVQVSFNDPMAFDPVLAWWHDPHANAGIGDPPEKSKPAPPPIHNVQSATSGALTEAEMRAVLTEAGWPEYLHNQALAVAWCESRWNPGAIGDHGASVGLFQVQWSGSSWRGWFLAAGEDEAMRLDPVVNARTALWAYNRSGWGPWTCQP